MAYEVQEYLREYAIKFRPIRPRSPHLNGKVERAQKTDLDEFYSLVSLSDADLPRLENGSIPIIGLAGTADSRGKPPRRDTSN